MLKYMGSKERYATKISNLIRRVSAPYWSNSQFWEACCGTARVSYNISKPTNLIDLGPWGLFWKLAKHKPHLEEAISIVDQLPDDTDAFMDMVKHISTLSIPEHPAEFLSVFAMLQTGAFRGKAVEMYRGKWKCPGWDVRFSKKACIKGMQQCMEIEIQSAVKMDVNRVNIPEGSVIYIDPDYKGTTGYGGREVLIGIFLSRNRKSDVYMSHNTPLKGYRWDDVVEITGVNNKTTFLTDPREFVHIKRREA